MRDAPHRNATSDLTCATLAARHSALYHRTPFPPMPPTGAIAERGNGGISTPPDRAPREIPQLGYARRQTNRVTVSGRSLSLQTLDRKWVFLFHKGHLNKLDSFDKY